MITSKALIALCAVAAVASGCTRSSAMRTSQNTAIIQTSAAPICGAGGAARAAQSQAAIETIKAGYDRYIIGGAASANNVGVAQMPGSYQTSGTITARGNLNATTTYRPGGIIVYGSHDQQLGITMFREGEPGSAQAISARDILGPKWASIVKSGVHSCAG